MTAMPTDELAKQKLLRLWPGVLVVVLQWLAWLVLPKIFPDAALYAMLGGVVGGGLAVVLWWLFFSRAPWLERVGAIVLMPLALYATFQIVHPSVATGGMGMLLLELRTGNLACLLEFKSGVEEVFDVQVLPGLRRPLVSGPFAGQDGGEVIWTVPQPNG